MRSAVWVFLILLLTSLAGCAGKPAAEGGQGVEASTPAAIPVVNDSAGSITGSVLSEELVPIEGAQVALNGAVNVAVTTDGSGRFTFNELPEGEYKLFAQQLGYEARGLAATVAPGQVTHVNITLVALEIQEEAYYALNNMVGFIELGQSYFDYYASWDVLNQCSKCEFYVHLKPSPHDIRFEAWWTKSINVDVISHNIYFLVRKNWDNNTLASQEGSTKSVVSGYFNYGEMPRPMAPTAPQSNATATEKLKGVDKIQVRIGGGFSSISFQQKVDMWMSFAYNGPFPDDFSAYPKP